MIRAFPADKEEPMIQARCLAATVTAWLLAVATVSAQTAPAKFHWQAGQVLNYKVEQVTNETEVVGGTKVESTMKLSEMKRWQVLAVDSSGVATVQQSLTALRIEKTDNGASVVFDSAHPDKSDAGMNEQLKKYVGTALATLRIDAQGKVVEVKESKYAPATRYENELPFSIVLPPTGIQSSQGWQRTYQVTLEPPLGTNEKYPAAQKYTCKEIAGQTARIAVATEIQGKPEDQVPLVQFQPEGDITFDMQAGRLQKARLAIDKELKGHQGDDSSYHFKSVYTEEYVGDK
jgi:hypothetical protein